MPAKTIKVLDVGSYSVNGSYRKLFPAPRYEYIGMDMLPGPNVDIVEENPYTWKSLPDDSFDVVICGQVFEHAEFFWITMTEIARVLKKDGLACIIAPNTIHQHRYPVDCYRFYTDGMVALARYVNLKPLHAHVDSGPKKKNKGWFSRSAIDAMLVAQKPYSGKAQLISPENYKCVAADHEHLRTVLHPYKMSAMGKAVNRLYKMLIKRV